MEDSEDARHPWVGALIPATLIGLYVLWAYNRELPPNGILEVENTLPYAVQMRVLTDSGTQRTSRWRTHEPVIQPGETWRLVKRALRSGDLTGRRLDSGVMVFESWFRLDTTKQQKCTIRVKESRDVRPNYPARPPPCEPLLTIATPTPAR